MVYWIMHAKAGAPYPVSPASGSGCKFAKDGYPDEWTDSHPSQIYFHFPVFLWREDRSVL